MNMRKTIILSTLLLSISSLFGQSELDFEIELEASTDEFEVVTHAENSVLADSINIEGYIVKSYGGICGDLCTGGTIKVRLLNQVKNYKHDYIYIVTACTEKEFTKESISLYVTHYTGKENECYYKEVVNIANSQGIPFYKISEEETKKIAK